MLRWTGYDAAAGRGVYQLLPLKRSQTEDLASRWQMEVGVRYAF
jgi:hypothetical protein